MVNFILALRIGIVYGNVFSSLIPLTIQKKKKEHKCLCITELRQLGETIVCVCVYTYTSYKLTTDTDKRQISNKILWDNCTANQQTF